jgi:hypothetical protein
MPTRNSRGASLFVSLAIGMAMLGKGPESVVRAQQDPSGLFLDAPGQRDRNRPVHPSVVRSRLVTVNPAVWPDSRRPDLAAGRKTLLLNLFDNQSYSAVLDRVEPVPNGFSWVGHIPGRALSTVTLTTVDGVMAGSIVMPGAVYAIRNAGGVTHEVTEVDQSRFLRESNPIPVRLPGRRGVTPSADPIPSADSGSTIDVMVLYTPEAAAASGGTAAMAAWISLGISQMNVSYTVSNVGHRLRLVHIEEVPYTENDNLALDLYNLSNDDGTQPLSTALGNTAAALRNAYRADLVQLLTAPASPNSCGVAWLMDSVSSAFEAYGFSVVEQSCVSPNFSLQHEFGHNMGARHDWFVDNGTTPQTYAHGYVDTVNQWRTIMAYDDLCAAQSLTCTRLPFWSNPATPYFGSPMGIPGGTKSDCPTGDINNVACDADDHRTLNDSAVTVANFRSPGLQLRADFTADLKADILWHHATAGDVWLWPMDGATRTAETYLRTVADTNWEIRGTGDQNGDGYADVLWRNKVTGMVYLWLMQSGFVLAETYVATVDPAYDIVGTGDYNGDGKSDILWRHTTNGEVWIWLMIGPVPVSQVYVATVEPGYIVKGSGDLNGDGNADIVWHHATAGEVWAWLMNGTTRLSATWVGTVPDVGYQVVGVADFTGDGKADILWHHATAGEVWLWSMDGATRVAQTWVGTVPDTNYRIGGTGDYNGNGKADILWHHATAGEVWVWTMDGATRLAQSWVATVPDVGYRIVEGR